MPRAEIDGRSMIGPRGRQEVELPLVRREVVLDHALAGQLHGALLAQLAPHVRARVLHRPGVVHVRRELPVHVVVPERDVAPPGRSDLVRAHFDDRPLRRRGGRREHSGDLAVDQEDVVLERRVGLEHRDGRHATRPARRESTGRDPETLGAPPRRGPRGSRVARTAAGCSPSRTRAANRGCRRSSPRSTQAAPASAG